MLPHVYLVHFYGSKNISDTELMYSLIEKEPIKRNKKKQIPQNILHIGTKPPIIDENDNSDEITNEDKRRMIEHKTKAANITKLLINKN